MNAETTPNAEALEVSEEPLRAALRAVVPGRDLAADVWRERAARALFGAQTWPTIGRYRIEGRLGSGGFGEVFEAFDPTLERSVAIKMLKLGAGERLVDEGRKLARISHSHVVSVYEVGEHEGRVYLVMELLGGGSLARIDALPVSLEGRLDLIIQACEGVEAAHHAGVMHGDFKPSNVLLDDTGRAKVADFGLAKLEDEISRPGGTRMFMAPEQATDGPSRSADQFSICRTLEAVLGEDLPAALRPIVLRGTRDDPNARFRDVAALRKALLGVRNRRSRRTVYALGAAAVLGIGAATVFALDGEQACQAPTHSGPAIWSEATQREVEQAFTAVDYGEASWTRLDGRLEEYERSVDEAWLETCDLDPALRSRAQRCLSGRLDDMQSLVEALRVPSEQAIERAVVAAAGLEHVDTCLDPGLELAARSPIGSAVDTQLRRASVQLRLGDWDQAVADAEQASLIAYRSGDTRLIARTLLTLGMAEARKHGVARAERSLRSAFELAHSIGAERLARAAALQLAWAHARSASFEDARDWISRLQELGGDQTAAERGERAVVETLLLDAEGDHEASRSKALEAVALLRDADRPEQLGRVLNHLGEMSFDSGAYVESRAQYEDAVETWETSLGPAHPWLAGIHGNLGELSLMLSQPEQAEQHFATAYAIRKRSYGEAGFWTVHTRAHLADSALARGDLDLAEQRYQAVLDHVEGFEPETGTLLAWADYDAGVDALDDWAYAGLSLVALRRDDPERAVGFAQLIAHDGLRDENRHVDHGSRLDLLALAQLQASDPDRAYTAAHAAWRAVYGEYGPAHFKSAFVYETLGAVLADLGECEQAAPYLRGAAAIWSQDGGMAPRERGVLQIATLCPTDEKKRR